MAIEIVIPRLGWTMDEGTFAEWLKEDGAWVNKGDMLFTIEGDKATQEVESFDEGFLRRLTSGPRAGDVVKVGQTIGYLAAEGEVVDVSGTGTEAQVASEATSPRETPAASGPAARRLARRMGVDLSRVQGTGPRGRIVTSDLVAGRPVAPSASTTSARATPRARRAAKESGVDWRTIPGTGRDGRVRERDVRAWAAPSETLSEFAGESRLPGAIVPLRPLRRRIAQRLSAWARETVPVTLTTTADATQLVAARRNAPEPRPSYHDWLLYLLAPLLRQHRLLTAQWRDDGLFFPEDVHIGLAIEVDDGLLVPVVRHVDRLTVEQIVGQTRTLAERARRGELTADEMRDGTFTVTSLGMYGIEGFTPVLLPPQSAILGVGAIRLEPAVVEGRVEPRHRVSLSLTFDHRVLDGAPAARFLQALRRAVETSPS